MRALSEAISTAALAVSVTVAFGPSAASAPHRHQGPVFGHVLEGELEFAVGDANVRTLKAGDTFYEAAMELHAVSRNPSDKVKTLVLTVLVHPRDAKELVIPEPAKKEKVSDARFLFSKQLIVGRIDDALHRFQSCLKIDHSGFSSG